jgi:hypothetical protein
MGHTVEAYVWDTQKMQARALKATAAAGSQSAPAR